MSHNITVESGSSVRLPTAGKYCDRDIRITATGGAEELDDELNEQEELIDDLYTILSSKVAASPTESVIEPLAITENGTYTAPEGVDGYSPISVDVPVPEGYIAPSGTLEVTKNGEHDVTEYSSVNVNVAGDVDAVVAKIIAGTITTIESQATSICEYGLRARTSLTTISMPKVTKTGTYALYGCTSLTSVDMPNLSSLGTYTFARCSGIKYLRLPKAGAITSFCFNYCSNLVTLDLPAATSFAASSLAACSKLTALILRRSTVVSLNATNALGNTPIASGTGYIYVPSALINSYKEATNWSTHAAQFRAIEDYPEITGG